MKSFHYKKRLSYPLKVGWVNQDFDKKRFVDETGFQYKKISTKNHGH